MTEAKFRFEENFFLLEKKSTKINNIEIESTISLFYNNKEHKEYIGYCSLKKTDNITIYIKYITIEKKYRGQELSKIFMKLLEEEFTKDKIKWIEIEIDEINQKHKKLENLYREIGFEINGKERYENRGDYLVRRVPMKKKIIKK